MDSSGNFAPRAVYDMLSVKPKEPKRLLPVLKAVYRRREYAPPREIILFTKKDLVTLESVAISNQNVI